MWISGKRICLQCRRRTGDAREIWGRSLGQEDTLEKEMAAQHSCLLNPVDRGFWGLQSMRSQRVGHDLETKQQQYYICFLVLLNNRYAVS